MALFMHPILTFLFFYAALTFSASRWAIRSSRLCFIFSFIAIWLTCCACIFFVLPAFFLKGLCIITLLIATLLLFSEPWQEQLLFAILWCILFSAAEGVIHLLLDLLFYGSSSESTKTGLFFLLSLLAHITACGYFIRRSEICTRYHWLTIFICYCGIFALCVVFTPHKQTQLHPLFWALGIMLTGAIILTSLLLLHKKAYSAKQKYSTCTTSNTTALRQANHEFMHQMQTIDGLLACGSIEDAQEYIRQLQSSHIATTQAINTHHPVINTILNSKYQAAVLQDTDMQIRFNDLAAVSIDTNSLVILLSNLLDNSLEACMRMDEGRKIECIIEATDVLFLSVRNTSLPVNVTNGHIETTKDAQQEHGFGLPNIRNVLDMLGGEYAYHYQDGWFHFVAEIPLNSPEKITDK